MKKTFPFLTFIFSLFFALWVGIFSLQYAFSPKKAYALIEPAGDAFTSNVLLDNSLSLSGKISLSNLFSSRPNFDQNHYQSIDIYAVHLDSGSYKEDSLVSIPVQNNDNFALDLSTHGLTKQGNKVFSDGSAIDGIMFRLASNDVNVAGDIDNTYRLREISFFDESQFTQSSSGNNNSGQSGNTGNSGNGTNNQNSGTAQFISNVSLDRNTMNISGDFHHADFINYANAHGGIDPNNPIPITLYLFSQTTGDYVPVQPFQSSGSNIISFNSLLNSIPQGPLSLYIEWKDGNGGTKSLAHMPIDPQGSSGSNGSSSGNNGGLYPEVTFSIDKVAFANYVSPNGKTVWGVRFGPENGQGVHRTRDETVYLILKKDLGDKKQALCKFDGGGGLLDFAGPNFPGCSESNPDKLFKINGVKYGASDILKEGSFYSVYFSSDINGSIPISPEISIGKPLTTSEEFIGNIQVDVKEEDKKGVYTIGGSVVKKYDSPAQNLSLSLQDEQGRTYPLGNVENQKDKNFSFVKKGLHSGRYMVIVKSKDGQGNEIVVQRIILQKEIPDYSNNNQNSGGNTQGSGSYSTYSDYSKDHNTKGWGIVPQDCGYDISGKGRMCTLNDFIRLIRRVVDYIFILMIPIAAIVTAYAGYLILFSGGNTSKIDAAKKMFKSLFTGIVLFMLAWLIIRAITTALGLEEGFNLFWGK